MITLPSSLLPGNQSALLGQPSTPFLMQNSHPQTTLWQILQRNHEHLLAPFNHQLATHSNSLVDPSSFLNEEQMSWMEDEARFDGNTDDNEYQTNENWTDDGLFQELWQNKNGTDESMGELSEEEEEQAKEVFTKWLEDIREEVTDLAEKDDELFRDYSFYVMILLPFLIRSRKVAMVTFITKVMAFITGKLGFSNEAIMLFQLFMECIDKMALGKGKFKLTKSYKLNWYVELYDYMLKQLGVNDAIRQGTQFLMPVGPMPNTVQ